MDTELIEALDCLEGILRGVDPEEITITQKVDREDFGKAERVIRFLVKHGRLRIIEDTPEKLTVRYTK